MKDKKIKFNDKYTYLDDLDEYILTQNTEASERLKKIKQTNELIEEEARKNPLSEYNKKLYNTLHGDEGEIDTKLFEDPKDIARINYQSTPKGYFYKDNFKAKTFEEALKEIDIEQTKEDNFNYTLIENLKERVSNEEASMIAYLNIEFNILNKKTLSCCRSCFTSYDIEINQAKLCVNNCKVGINEAYNFVDDEFKNLKGNLMTCLSDNKVFKEKQAKFTSCYEKLITQMKDMKNVLKEEFSYYV